MNAARVRQGYVAFPAKEFDMRFMSLIICIAIAFATAPVVTRAAPSSSSSEAAALELFEKKIRPLFVENCYECHSANTNAKSGLRLDDLHGLLDGGEHGPAIIPGQPENSLLIRAVSYTDAKRKMPPKKQLSAEQVADLTQWIKDGAAWPKDPVVDGSSSKPNPVYDALRKQHWAWQPIRETPAPTVKDGSWGRDDLDRFLLTKLEEHGLKPAADANKISLIRRENFDLTGLPPTPAEIEAFAQDNSADALEKLVNRLLASPAFGEACRGRDWLDVARYGESTGPSRNVPYPHAWRYRDYVIDSFNALTSRTMNLSASKLPGDLLPASTQAEHDEHKDCDGLFGGHAAATRCESAVQGSLRDGQHRRADRYSRPVSPRPHARLRPLPRSQIRSDSDRRLLRDGGGIFYNGSVDLSAMASAIKWAAVGWIITTAR